MNPHEKYRTMIKDNLRHEINNIALDLALKRETALYRNKDKMNSTYHATNMTWKSPSIEGLEKNFKENYRFFSSHKELGTRYIVPPKAEYLSQLKEEKKFYDDIDKAKTIKNTLLSDTYSYKSKGKMNSQRYKNKDNLVEDRINNYRQLFKDANGELVNSTTKVLKGLKRFEASSDSQALMYMNSDTTHGKILKFAD